jgi:hypothetical protein
MAQKSLILAVHVVDWAHRQDWLAIRLFEEIFLVVDLLQLDAAGNSFLGDPLPPWRLGHCW